jgi:YesN/AraC family two-component response regulator
LRVLIADDVQETRRNTRLMLATIDDVEVVAIAANGIQTVQLAKEHYPDILLLDINMPEMDGLTAYRQIAQTHPDIGCIIISAEKDTTTLRTAMSIGVQEYLIKPYTIEELETAIARVYERVAQTRQKLVQAEQLRRRNEAYLQQLASEYARTRRTDDQAIEVFERLAENPHCEPRWLQNLAMIYVIRQMWGRLKILAEKVEQRKKQ